MRLQAEVVERIADIPAATWDGLDPTGNPFLRHAFLEALESAGCVGGETGWHPHHLVVREAGGRVVGAVPQYLKSHSWGEFIFDWNWAQSHARAGLAYYPKLLAAVPFTPVTGPRLLAGDAAGPGLRDALARLLQESAHRGPVSGAHVNFTTAEDQASLEAAGFLRRHDCRFVWFNRGYRDFADFLEGFRSARRKKTRRERRRIHEQGIEFRTLRGADLDSALWRTVFAFSEHTFLRHGSAHYLNAGFFDLVARRMPEAVMVKLAERAGEPLAAAIFLQGGRWLYGRYWGAREHIDCLHFEACYYQGIEYCIEHGLAGFDPGTQGEHKLARGFEPTLTHSAHWLAHPGFAAAVARHLARERAAVDDYIASARTHLPFQREATP